MLPGDEGYDELVSANLSGGIPLTALGGPSSAAPADLAGSAPTPGGGAHAPAPTS